MVDAQTLRWKSLAELRECFGEVGLDDPQAPAITYCGGGIAASVTFFALALLGHRNVALYDNSLLAWSADPARPMER